MPRASPTKPETRPKPSLPSKKRTAAKRAREDSPGSTPPLQPSSSPLLDKGLVLRIILAKLESSKSCDWFALSQSLSSSSTPIASSKVGAKGKKSKNGSVGAEGISGGELHDLYHNTILPALKAGRALWSDEAIAGDLFPQQKTPATPAPDEEDVPITPAEEEADDIVAITDIEAEGEEETEEVRLEEEEGDGMLLEELEALEKANKKRKLAKRPSAIKKQTYGGVAKRQRNARATAAAKRYAEDDGSEEENG